MHTQASGIAVEIGTAQKEVAEAKEVLAIAEKGVERLCDAASQAESLAINSIEAAQQPDAANEVKERAEAAAQAAKEARNDAEAAQRQLDKAREALEGSQAKADTLAKTGLKAQTAEHQSSFSRRTAKHRWSVLVYGAVGVYILINIVFVVIDYGNDERLLRTMLAGTLFKFVLLLAIIWFVKLFTKPLLILEGLLPGTSGTTATPEQHRKEWEGFIELKQRWMIFAYGFMIFAIMAAVYPYMFDFVPDADHEELYKQYIAEKLDAPISVFRGCVRDKDGEPEELRCYPEGQEQEGATPRLTWIIHIGGEVQSFELKARRDEAAKQANADVDEMQKKAGEDLERSIAGQVNGNSLPDMAKQSESSSPDAGTEAQRFAASGAVKSTADESLNAVAAQGNAGFSVRGGLAVPLYMIILALIGGAISLTRRVPEYQKQAEPSYVPTEQAPKLTPAMLREYLVFQIVQFISAPFLAIVAYYLIEPGNPTATVAIAFIAGFASETVLLMVRAVVDKVQPITSKPARTGSVAGTVFSSQEKIPVQGAQVRVVGIQGQETETDAEGQFVLNGVTAGEQAVEVSKEEKRTFAAVKIESERATLAPSLRLDIVP